MRNIARERSLSLYRMVLLKDPFDIDEEQVHMSLLAGQFLKDREQLFNIEMTADEQKNIEQTLEHVYASTKIQKELLSIIKTESFFFVFLSGKYLYKSRGNPLKLGVSKSLIWR